MSFARGISYSLVSQIVSAAFQVLTGIVTARALGVEGRGIYTLFFSNGAVIATAMYFGITQAIIYDRNRRNIENDVLLGNALLLLVAQAAVLSLLIFAFHSNYSKQVIGAESVGMAVAFWLLVLVLLSDMVLSGLVLGNHFYGINSSYVAAQNIVFFVAALPTLGFVVSGELAIEIRLATAVCLCLAIWRISLAQLPFNRPKVSINVLGDSINFGMGSYAQNLIGMLNSRAGLALVGIFSSISEVGTYSVALLIISSIRLIPDAIGTILLPKLTTLEVEENTRLSALVFKGVILLSVGLCAVLVPISAPLILLLFGNDYAGAIVPTQIMLIGGLFGAAYQILTRVFTSDAKQKNSIVAAGTGLCAMCVASIVLIPEYGALGAAAGFMVGNILTAVLIVGLFCRSRKVRLAELLVPTRVEVVWVRDHAKAFFFSLYTK
jgi:O-antigen/teichoic acid export membrane protein